MRKGLLICTLTMLLTTSYLVDINKIEPGAMKKEIRVPIKKQQPNIKKTHPAHDLNAVIRSITALTHLSQSSVREILYQSRKTGIPVSLYLGLFEVESHFHHKSINKRTGASGLGQLMPGTAKSIARLNKKQYSRGRLLDPLYNIRLVTDYIQYKQKRWKTDWYWIVYWYGEQSHSYTKKVMTAKNKYHKILLAYDIE